MRYRASLRLRFTLATMALVAAISALVAVAVHESQEVLEDQLLLELMQREVAEYARAYHLDPSHMPPRSTQLRSYIVDPARPDGLPPELAGVPPGITHDVVIDGRNYQVANFVLEDKRFYLAYDITLVEEREAWLSYALLASVLCATALGGAIGWRLSHLVLAPVMRLAEEIKGLDPEHPAPRFGGRFPDVEVGVIAAAFDYYVARLAAFIERERAFTEDASHELRTPIAVVNTAVERLVTDGVLPGSLRPVVERLGRAGKQMEATTQALLFMAREQEPADHAMDRAPLSRVIDEVVDAERPALAGRPVELRRGGTAAGAPDVPKGLAAMVVGNLLHNAVGNTAEGVVELEQDGAQLIVRDTGAGIAAADLPHLFERRFRGRNAGGGGLGLGLHIVKRICDRQGWSIQVDSTPGRGATFTVVFTTKVAPDFTQS
jgi:signal transduction histidine kinase